MSRPIGFRFKVHTGPCGIDDVVTRLRGMDGYGFDVAGGIENVYFSAFVEPEAYAPFGGPASYVAEQLSKVLGWRPLRVVVHDILPDAGGPS